MRRKEGSFFLGHRTLKILEHSSGIRFQEGQAFVEKKEKNRTKALDLKFDEEFLISLDGRLLLQAFWIRHGWLSFSDTEPVVLKEQ